MSSPVANTTSLWHCLTKVTEAAGSSSWTETADIFLILDQIRYSSISWRMFQEGSIQRNVAIFFTTTIALVTSIYFMRLKKKKVKSVTARESFISNRNLSWFSLVPMGDAGAEGVLAAILNHQCLLVVLYYHYIRALSFFDKYRQLILFQYDQSAGTHPEGPNIGYNSNSSWFDNKQNDDDDKLQSHTKGNNAKFIEVVSVHTDKS